MRFVDQYVRDCNATQAAIRAGFSRQSANYYGPYLVRQPEMAVAIAARMAQETRRLRILADRVVLELMRIAFSDIRAYLTQDGKTGAVTLKPAAALEPDQTAAILFLSTGSRNHGPSLRLHGKKRALAALARHLGLDDRRHFVDPQIELEATAQVRRALMAAAGIDEPKALPAPAGVAP
jgi:phage terminase small subunit